MAEVSAIEWTHATFNPWLGCTKLSRACDNCYAEPLVVGRLGGAWGAGQPRRRTAASTWKAPLAWDRKAAKEGRRMRVFCASLADVFDAEVPDAWRDDLFALIAQTPSLDWLLLTKRPKVAQTYITGLPERRREMACHAGLDWCEWPLPNVWLGTTVEDQKMAEARIPLLLDTPAAVRFLSMEPLLGPVDLSAMDAPNADPGSFNALAGQSIVTDCRGQESVRHFEGLDWVITGGESGPGARPTHPEWFRTIRDQCAAAGVPFLFKQWGDWAPGECAQHAATRTERTAELINDEWHFGSLSPQASQEMHCDDEPDLYRIGKARAGRWLDGVLHDGYPVGR